MWFIIALLGYTLLGLVVVLDKFILTKSMGRPAVYTFYSTVFLSFLFVLLPFGVQVLSGVDLGVALLSGLLYDAALLSLFLAIKKGETSHVIPFNGAICALILFCFAPIFFHEAFTRFQIAGAIVLILSALLLSFEKTRQTKFKHKDFLWAALSALLFAVSMSLQKYIYTRYDFYSALVWLQGFSGLVSFLFLLYKPVRRTLYFAGHPSKIRTFGKRHIGLIIFSNKILSAVAILLIQYAISLGSLALVSALGGVQYVFSFVVIYLLTKCAPRILQEYFTKRELQVETAAMVLVVIGSALLAF